MSKSDLVVVTGAGGFIGGHLVKVLQQRGHTKIRAVDVKPLNEWYQKHPGVENQVGDLALLEPCRAAAKGAKMIYNLAADMGGMGFIENNKALCMLSVLINTHLLMAAKAAGVDVKKTEFVTRGTALPDVGVSGAVDTAVFALNQGDVSAPIAADNAVVVAHVLEKQAGTPEGLAAERDTLRGQLLQQARQEFFASYMTKAKTKMKIQINQATVKQLIGG